MGTFCDHLHMLYQSAVGLWPKQGSQSIPRGFTMPHRHGQACWVQSRVWVPAYQKTLSLLRPFGCSIVEGRTVSPWTLQATSVSGWAHKKCDENTDLLKFTSTARHADSVHPGVVWWECHVPLCPSSLKPITLITSKKNNQANPSQGNTWQIQNTWPIFSKTTKFIKSKESLRKCRSPEKPKETPDCDVDRRRLGEHGGNGKQPWIAVDSTGSILAH